ncbi:Fur family transcriptional regulator [Mesotoga sp.]|jgi:Fur family ferric uptake transcriptional regulator|uniref:Fe2+/Zn2+ uptake regulation protein n=1 Tax=Mesotoga infera TaxID=1236046 RepID=A0A101IA12_9BACT|nr:MAG: Fe2+/Zn2+ uptake regulation protein [Mesotoga infera]KUK91448.1 MAG: Fe2+/Zn2+ uptake regulation protein [Mesotoga infera]HCO70485.1 transcriptional repressor [Mesotoga infera]
MKKDLLRAELKKRNQRMTAQREYVLRFFLEAETDHLSADEVYQKVQGRKFSISKATVYRTIELLVEIGLLRKIIFRDGIVRYEPVKKGEHHHHHIICVNCGTVVEFHLDNLEKLEELVKSKTGYTIDDHQLKFYGLCPKCQSTMKNRNNDNNDTR